MFSNRRTILHVDDDPAFTSIVASSLEQAGFEVDSIHDPLEVIDAIRREQYQVVLLDVDMPVKSGMLLLSEIKYFDGGVQVIMLSGVVSHSIVIEALRCGAEDYLFKPFDDPELLIEVVSASFRRIDRWWAAFRDLTKRQRTAQPEQAEATTVATS
ncbi:MAG: response regulator [Aeoliella sp.]